MDASGLKPYLITERLLLRPWEETDMYDLYEQAKNPNVGPPAGWPVHASPEHSRMVIQTVFSKPGEYAIVPRTVRKAVGAVDLKFGSDANICLGENESEIGYWIGEDYWGNGYVPEAVKALLQYGFEELGLERIWCLCRIENGKSVRVQEKCGFRFVRNGTIDDPVYGVLEMRFTALTREEWSSLAETETY